MPDKYDSSIGLARNEVILEESRHESETDRLIHPQEIERVGLATALRGVLASLFQHNGTQQENDLLEQDGPTRA